MTSSGKPIVDVMAQYGVVGYFSGHLHHFLLTGVPTLEKLLIGRHESGARAPCDGMCIAVCVLEALKFICM